MAKNLYSGVSEQAKASKHRLDDARVLLAGARWRGAMYLSGYAVECRLKTKLMQMYGCRNLGELEQTLRDRGELRGAGIFTHLLMNLVRLTGALDRFRNASEHWRQFTLVNQWVPAWRYTADESDHDNAHAFLKAVEHTLHWIETNI